MKQKLYITGLITTLAIILGIVFKINHYPGAGVLTTAGIAFLLLVFIPMALINHYKNEGERSNLSLYIVTWLTCLVVFTSMLFKVMHWPGAGYLIIIAIPFPFVVFLPVFLIVTSRIKNFNIHNTVYVLFLLAGLSLFTALLGLDVTRERIVDSFNIACNYNRMDRPLDRIKINEDNSHIVKSIDEVLAVIDDYQRLIYSSAGSSEEAWQNDPDRFIALASAYNGRSPLKTGKGAPDTRLEDGLRGLINELAAAPCFKNISKEAPDIFSLEPLAQNQGAWSKAVFENGNGAWIIMYLDGLKNNLRILRVSLNSAGSHD
jgi:hypothetical protein